MDRILKNVVTLLGLVGTAYLGTSGAVRLEQTLMERATLMRTGIARQGWRLNAKIKIQSAPCVKHSSWLDQVEAAMDELKHPTWMAVRRSLEYAEAAAACRASGDAVADGGSRLAGLFMHTVLGTKMATAEGGDIHDVPAPDRCLIGEDDVEWVGSEWTAVSAVAANVVEEQTGCTPRECVHALALTRPEMLYPGGRIEVADVAAAFDYKLDRNTVGIVKKMVDLLRAGIGLQLSDVMSITSYNNDLTKAYNAVFGKDTTPGKKDLATFIEAGGLAKRAADTNTIRERVGLPPVEKTRKKAEAPAAVVPDAMAVFNDAWTIVRDGMLKNGSPTLPEDFRDTVLEVVRWTVVDGKIVPAKV